MKAIKVKLRQKLISGERHSLYLDFYPEVPDPETGKLTRRDFLGFYIFDNPKTPSDKQHNKETFALAEQIRQKREIQLNKPEIYSQYEKDLLRIQEKGNHNFIEYFSRLCDKRFGTNLSNWKSSLKYLKQFTGEKLRFADLNEGKLEEFREFLLTVKNHKSQIPALSQNTALSYFNKVKATLKQAYKEGYLQNDINARLQPIKSAETHRNFLTIEELNKLVKTDCNDLQLKRVALFSALTGLRFCDIQNLTWNEIEFIKGQGYYLNFRQMKTRGVEVLPISDQAYDLCGDMRPPDKKVFVGLSYSAYHNKDLVQWLGAAGITKKITFHCFRHTYATLQLEQGTDLYTVSKMLGHRSIKTTQIYAKVVDKSKREATRRINLDI